MLNKYTLKVRNEYILSYQWSTEIDYHIIYAATLSELAEELNGLMDSIGGGHKSIRFFGRLAKNKKYDRIPFQDTGLKNRSEFETTQQYYVYVFKNSININKP